MNLFDNSTNYLSKAIEERELHCSQCKNWRRWNQAATIKIPVRHAVEILHGESDRALMSFLTVSVCLSPFLKVFRTCLDSTLGNLGLVLKLVLL